MASDGTCTYKAKLVHVVGDIPGVADLCCHSGHTSYTGCRMCTIRGMQSSKKRAIVFPPKMDKVGVFLKNDYRDSNAFCHGDKVLLYVTRKKSVAK